MVRGKLAAKPYLVTQVNTSNAAIRSTRGLRQLLGNPGKRKHQRNEDGTGEPNCVPHLKPLPSSPGAVVLRSG